MFTVLMLITGLFAGTFGALLGLGGGVIIIPVMTILLHLPIQTAVGVSLIGVIATSTGAAIVYVREGKADIRLGMTLELATTVGAIAGAVIAGYVSSKVLYLLFAALMAYNTYSMSKKNGQDQAEGHQGELEVAAGKAVVMDSKSTGARGYQVKNIPGGMFFSALAGIMAGLLGIGGGLVKIPVMYLLMGVPLKVAAATSNFMVGVTACASAFVYFANGYIDVLAAAPMALGVFAGAMIGTRINERVSTRGLKRIFMVVFIYVAVEMTLKGLGR